MLSPPHDLPEDVVRSTLRQEWGVIAGSIAYRPVGFGSHHWEVIAADGTRWFLTVDELTIKRRALAEPLAAAFDRLHAALAAARSLRDHGHAFVVAPVSTLAGQLVARVGDRFGAALYPFVNGQSFSWGDFSAPAHRRAILDLVVAVHTTPISRYGKPPADEFAIPHRDELAASLDGGDLLDTGPYASPMSALLSENAPALRRLLATYDDLVAESRAQPARAVLTHGEPHPGNTMLAAGQWLLIDWDTALVAPPERDLWNLDPGDGSILRAYAEATGVTPLPSMLELYRMHWDIADIAIEVSRFRKPHLGTPDDDKGWEILRSLVSGIGAA